MIAKFDELNNIQSDRDYLDIDDFFNDMQLSDKQIEDRKELAYDLKYAVLFLFALLRQGLRNYDYVLHQFQNMYTSEVKKRVEITPDLEEYISDITTSIVSICFLHIDAFVELPQAAESDYSSDIEDYYGSEKRAIIIAENESLSILNNDDYNKALDAGYTKKKWLTLKDNKVRKTHKAVDNQVLPIREYFQVGKSLMLYPHSIDAEPEEVVNCRCSIKYF